MDRQQFVIPFPIDYKPIWEMKTAVRRAEIERQLHAATEETEVEDVETGEPVVEVTWTPNRFEKARARRYAVHGLTEALDSNSRESLLLSVEGDPDAKWLTLGLHMVARIAPVKAE